MESKVIRPPVYYFGTPVVLVTTMNEDGTVNISPMSSAWSLGDRVILGMSETSMGRENLIRTRHAVLNFPDGKTVEKVESIARSTGRNPVPAHKSKIGYQYTKDKFKISGYSSLESEAVRPPRLDECPLQIEVELLTAHNPSPMPDGAPETFQILETRILRCHAHCSIIQPDGNHIDTEKWKPLFYIFRSYSAAGPVLGKTFKA